MRRGGEQGGSAESQNRPSEGAQTCPDGERLGRRDLISRTASSCVLPQFLRLYHGALRVLGGASQESTLADQEEKGQ